MIGRIYTWRGAYWKLLVRAQPFVAAPGMGPMRNVLIERVEPIPASGAHDGRGVWWRPTGERVVRPFRGLRRWRP